MKKRTKILGTFMSMILFGAIFTGSTLALYGSTKTVHVTVTSSSLHPTFYLTKMSYEYLNDNGEIEVAVFEKGDENDGTTKYLKNKFGASFSEDRSKGLNLGLYSEDIYTGVKIVPTLKAKFEFALYNVGDVAFDYVVGSQIASTNTGDYKLEDQVTFEYTGVVANTGVTYHKKVENTPDEFSVLMTFNDKGADNNYVMDQNFKYNVSVVCTQVVSNNIL